MNPTPSYTQSIEKPCFLATQLKTAARNPIPTLSPIWNSHSCITLSHRHHDMVRQSADDRSDRAFDRRRIRVLDRQVTIAALIDKPMRRRERSRQHVVAGPDVGRLDEAFAV